MAIGKHRIGNSPAMPDQKKGRINTYCHTSALIPSATDVTTSKTTLNGLSRDSSVPAMIWWLMFQYVPGKPRKMTSARHFQKICGGDSSPIGIM